MPFDIAGPSVGTIATILFLAVVMGLVGLYLWDKRDDNPALAWFALSVVFVAGAGLLFFSATMPFSRVVLHPRHLEIDIPIWGREIPLENIFVDDIQLIDLKQHPEYRPVWKSHGFSLGKFSMGWFDLARRGRAIVAVSGQHVLYIPTNQGFGILVQLENPEDFLVNLRAVATKRDV